MPNTGKMGMDFQNMTITFCLIYHLWSIITSPIHRFEDYRSSTGIENGNSISRVLALFSLSIFLSQFSPSISYLLLHLNNFLISFSLFISHLNFLSLTFSFSVLYRYSHLICFLFYFISLFLIHRIFYDIV